MSINQGSTLRTAAMAVLLAGITAGGLSGQEPAPVRPQHYAPGLLFLTAADANGPCPAMATLGGAYFLHNEIHSARQLESVRKQQAFWDNQRCFEAAVAVQLITAPDPYTMAFVRIKAYNFVVWPEEVYDPRLGAPELDAKWLLLIRDRTPMPNFVGRAPHERNEVELATYDLYCQALRFASVAPLEAFKKSAEENKYETFAQLYQSRTGSAEYRGKVIPIKGELKRLRRYPAPIPLVKRKILYVYEGYIQGPTPGAPPFCVVFPALPEDSASPTGFLEPAEEMNRPVMFYGYFFKLMTFPVLIASGKQTKMVDGNTPVLIGPTLILEPPSPPVKRDASISGQVLAIVAAFGGFAGVVLVCLTWWFRRGDRRFHEQVSRLHAAQALKMLENQEEGKHEG